MLTRRQRIRIGEISRWSWLLVEVAVILVIVAVLSWGVLNG